ncbi:hypothetical protein [Pantanalinema sp. GBBB05]|uniref:hypothetical protein n=1 Tax=Pantanalinema sp. GBBB05 TaxID=2604139 RepID=UPI001DCED87D|nr:hypothetical protein [Pantanalinema sp. GBBB05]
MTMPQDEMLMHGNHEPNTGTGSSDIAWIGRLITKVELSVDKLADRVDQMRQAIAVDQERMRDAFRSQVSEVDSRVDHLEKELVRLKLIASAATAIAMVFVVGLGAIAVPRMFGDRSGTEQRR